MANVDIYVGNNLTIDLEVYQLWINGYNAHEAAQIQQKRGVLQQYNATFEMLLSDTKDHYRTYFLLEDLLKDPKKMMEQGEFQIPADMQKILIERYYEFDQSLIREILGKKLSSRYRSSLDDVADKIKLSLRSCRRQFDNVKRVFRTVEDMMGSLVQNIQIHFRMSVSLAQQYAAIVFITNNRFETSKKKLQYLTFQDFIFCANEMITSWSCSTQECVNHDNADVDIDRDFLRGLRELKTLTEKDHIDEHRSAVQNSLKPMLSPGAAKDIEYNFKNMSKNILNIAYGLNHSKELRDLFLDLVEKVIEPCKNNGWTLQDIKTFLNAYTLSYQYMDFFRQNPYLIKVWEKYMASIQCLVVQMYHS